MVLKARVAIFVIAMMTVLGSGSAAHAQSSASGTFRLELTVQMVCRVSHQTAITATDNGYRLGSLQEYCNAPNGYSLAVDYQPGTMKGATISVGGEIAVLDGSGHTVLSRAPGPRIRNREIFAAPGPQGFDTDHLEFNVQAS